MHTTHRNKACHSQKLGRLDLHIRVHLTNVTLTNVPLRREKTSINAYI